LLYTGYEGTQRRYDTAVFETHLLPNGITVWMQKPPIITDDEGILIACFPTIGAIRDPTGKEGLAHFFEHIPFRGTARKPSFRDLIGPVESMGGEWNAATSTFWIKYFVTLPKDLFPLAVETIFEMSTAPLIREGDVALERGVIGEECKSKLADAAQLLHLHINQRLFGNHPFAHHTVGNLESIASMTAHDLKGFQAKFYRARNLHLICGGAFTERDDALSVIESAFGSLPDSGEAIPLPDFPEFIESNVELRDPRYGRDSFLMTWRLPRPEHNWEYPLQLLAGAVGDGQHTPLVSTLREKLGVVYDSHLTKTQQTPEPYPWSFHMYVRLGEEHFDQTHDVTTKAIRELASDLVIWEHRRRQRARRTAFIHPVRECHNTVEEILFDGHPVSFMQAAEENDAVTLDHVFAWRDYLVAHDPIVVRAIAK
jgi:predicted Zn-dependent peptidase